MRPDGLGRRAAQFGWLTAGLVTLALGLLVVAVVLASGQDRGFREDEVLVPLNAEFGSAGGAVVAAAAALVAATFLGLAALQSAAVMRVLDPDRHLPPPPPRAAQRVRAVMLGRLETEVATTEHVAQLPPSALLSPEELPSGTRLRCTVLVPAHDEEAILALTLASLAEQSRPPDRVVVIADNCTDRTAQLAAGAPGVEVVETVDNTEKKAGALNQQLERLLPDMGAEDVVMVMDADSSLAPEFLEVALRRLETERDLMAVGGLFYGEPGQGLVGQFQRNEYARYQRLVARKLDRVFVLTGTASVMRARALETVADARGTSLPGPPGQVYDTLALTEDNELTLALKTLGARLTSPPECMVTTEIMGSWRDLWRQRLRWHRGALENIGAYGLTRATALYWAQQLSLAYGVVALQSYLLLMTVTLLAADSIQWSPFWVAIGAIFLADRVVTVWRAGWPGRALAVPVLPEIAYAAYLQACFVTSLGQILLGRKASWNYVPRPTLEVLLPTWLLGPALLSPLGILLPASILQTDWYAALALWVGLNTLVFAALSVLQLLPPLHRHRTSPSDGTLR